MSDTKKDTVIKEGRLEAHSKGAIRGSLTDIKEILIRYYNDVTIRTKVAGLVMGHSGMGKTEAMRQVAERLGIDLVYLNCAMIPPEDVAGVPMKTKDLKVPDVPGTIEGLVALMKSYYSAPDEYRIQILDTLLPAFKPGARAILFLDEILQAQLDTIRALFPIILERRLGRFHLSDGVMVVAAGNPPDDARYMLNAPDQATQERFAFFQVETTRGEWIKYAETQGWNSTLIEFVKEHPSVFDENNPRRLEKVAHIMTSFEADAAGSSKSQHLLICLQSVLDLDHAHKLSRFMKDMYDIPGMSLLKGDRKSFSRLRKMLAAKDMAPRLYTIQNTIVDALRDPENILGDILCDADGKFVTEKVAKVAKNIMEYIEIVRKNHMDSAVGFLAAVNKEAKPELLSVMKPEIDDLMATEHTDFMREYLAGTSLASWIPEGKKGRMGVAV